MNEQEVNALREEIFADGKVTKEEVLNVWEKKDAQEETSCAFDCMFAEVVMAWLMADGKIDEEEAKFLVDKIGEDGEIDDAEDELLLSIAEECGNDVPQCLIDAFPEYFDEAEDEE